jgi:PAS domain-containing protein
MAGKMLNLIPTDVDRVIGQISPNLQGVNLEQLIAECIDGIAPIEREVQDREGRWCALRIRPYRSVDNKIDGAVLSLFDIDALKRHEAAARTALAFAETVVEAASDAMVLLDRDGRIRQVNEAFARHFGVSADAIRGRALADVVHSDDGLGTVMATLSAGVSTTEPISLDLEVAGGLRSLGGRVRMTQGLDAAGDVIALITVAKSPTVSE